MKRIISLFLVLVMCFGFVVPVGAIADEGITSEGTPMPAADVLMTEGEGQDVPASIAPEQVEVQPSEVPAEPTSAPESEVPAPADSAVPEETQTPSATAEPAIEGEVTEPAPSAEASQDAVPSMPEVFEPVTPVLPTVVNGITGLLYIAGTEDEHKITFSEPVASIEYKLADASEYTPLDLTVENPGATITGNDVLFSNEWLAGLPVGSYTVRFNFVSGAAYIELPLTVAAEASPVEDEGYVLTDEDWAAVEELNALIAELPTVDEVRSRDGEGQNEAYLQTQAVYDKWAALSSNVQLFIDISKIEALFNFFNALVDPLASSCSSYKMYTFQKGIKSFSFTYSNGQHALCDAMYENAHDIDGNVAYCLMPEAPADVRYNRNDNDPNLMSLLNGSQRNVLKAILTYGYPNCRNLQTRGHNHNETLCRAATQALVYSIATQCVNTGYGVVNSIWYDAFGSDGQQYKEILCAASNINNATSWMYRTTSEAKETRIRLDHFDAGSGSYIATLTDTWHDIHSGNGAGSFNDLSDNWAFGLFKFPEWSGWTFDKSDGTNLTVKVTPAALQSVRDFDAAHPELGGKMEDGTIIIPIEAPWNPKEQSSFNLVAYTPTWDDDYQTMVHYPYNMYVDPGRYYIGIEGIPRFPITVHKTGDFFVNASPTTETPGYYLQWNEQPLGGSTFWLYAAEDIGTYDKSVIFFHQGERITAEDGTPIVLTTGPDGNATSDPVCCGKYVVVEQSAPAGYTLFSGSVSLSNGMTFQHATTVEIPFPQVQVIPTSGVTVNVKNDHVRIDLSVVKTDAETAKAVRDVEFSLYAGEDIYDYTNGTLVIPKDALIEVARTDDTGYAYFHKDLPCNHAYYVKETAVPPTYLLNSETVYNFRFDYVDDQPANAVIKRSYTFSNVPVKAEITFIKQDKETGNTPQGDAVFDGAVYGLFARENILHPDGYTNNPTGGDNIMGKPLGLLYTAGEKVAEVTISRNPDGTYGGTFSNLYVGKYYIKEVKAPTGYICSTDEYDLDCTPTGAVVPVIKASTTVLETPIKQAFHFLKTIKDDSNHTSVPLPGAGFCAWLKSDLVKAGYVDGAGNAYVPADWTAATAAVQPVVLGSRGEREIFSAYNGYVETIPIPYGVYIFKETTTPKDYMPIEDFEVTIPVYSDTDDREYPAPQDWGVAPNKPFESYIRIVKKDSESGKTVLVPNAKYRIYDIDNSTYVEQYNTYSGETLGSRKTPFATNSEGVMVLLYTLPVGHYRIEEVGAPEGYLLNDTPIVVYVTTDTPHQWDANLNGYVIEVPFEDDVVKGEIEIEKLGYVQDKFSNGNFSYTKQPMDGAEFTIYAEGDIYTTDHQVDSNGKRILASYNGKTLSDGTVVAVLTTKGGKASITDLPLGVYRIVETKAPNGYYLSGEEVQVANVAYVNEETPIAKLSFTMDNVTQKIDLQIKKLNAETDAPLGGAVFGLYAAENIYNVPYGTSTAGAKVVAAKDTELARVTTSAIGTAFFDELDLPLGKYYIKEIKAPDGYIPASDDSIPENDRIDVDASYQGQDLETITLSYTAKNNPTTVQLKKVDARTNEEISGANLTVYDKDHHVVDSWITERGKEHIIKALHIGEEYTLREERAPYGYLLAQEVKFTVQNTESVQVITMKDDVPYGHIIVDKDGELLESISTRRTVEGWLRTLFKWAVGPLPNVTFDIYAAADIKAADGVSPDYFKEGDLVATITTGTNGIASLDKIEYKGKSIGLPLGRYKIVEKRTVDGYKLDGEPRFVDLLYADQNTEEITYSEAWENVRQKLSLSLLKVDKNHDNAPIEGALFGLYTTDEIRNKNGEKLLDANTLIEEMPTGVDGRLLFEVDLPVGHTYLIKELKAADGYASNNTTQTYTFAPGPNGDVTTFKEIVFENETTKVLVSKKPITNGTIELPGAKMEVRDKTGLVVDSWTSTTEPHLIEKLLVGETYTLHEELAPYGFLQAQDVEFTVRDTGEVQPIEMVDDIPFGHIIIDKRGELLESIAASETSDGLQRTQFNWAVGAMPSVTFDVYAGADIKSADGVSPDYFKEGDLVATITTGSSGIASLQEVECKGKTIALPLGRYKVVEKETIQGFKLDTEPRFIDLVYADQNTKEITYTESWQNDRQKLSLQILKVDKDHENEPIKGAKFGLYTTDEILNKDGKKLLDANTLIEERVSGADGMIVFDADLPVGHTYLLKELKAADGYASNHETHRYTFAPGPNGDVNTVMKVVFENETTKVLVSKKPITNDQIELPGARLEVRDKNGKVVDSWTSTAEPHLIEKLLVGETYTLHEELAPYGFLQAQDVQFTVQDTGDIQYVEMVDDIPYGHIIIDKRGELLESVTPFKTFEGWLRTLFNWAIGPMPNVTFEVYAGADIKSADGVSPDYFKEGDLVATITTGASGIASLDEVKYKDQTIGLPLGRYKVVEKKTIDGFKLDGKPRFVDLVYADQYTKEITYTESWENTRQTLSLQVLKVDSDHENKPIKGAMFGLFTTDEIFNKDGKKILNANQLIEEMLTGDDGRLVFTADLPVGHTYLVKELKAADGYASNNTTQTYTFTPGSNDKVNTVKELVFENETTKVLVSKKTATSQDELPGAKLEVRDKDGNVVDSWASTTEPHLIEQLLVGETYTLHEDLAPLGYATASDVEFTIEDTGEIQPVEMVDEITKVTLSKKDITNKSELPGAKLQILDKTGKVVDEWTSTDEPHYVEGLYVGETYTMVETRPADGYATAEVVEFTVEDTGKIQPVEMFDEPIRVSISKKEATNGDELPGAKLTLYDKDHNVVESWISKEEPHIIEKLVAGETYTLHEDLAPLGYATASDVTFTVADTGVLQVVEMVDEITKVSFSKKDVTNKSELPGAKLQVLDKKGNVIDEWVSTEKEHLIEGLYVGNTYTMVETRPADGYATAEVVEFTIEDTGKIQPVEMFDAPTKVAITKLDATTGEELPGAKLQVLDSDGNVVDEWVSSDIPHIIEKLVVGQTYTLREDLAPLGYATATEITFVIEDTGETQFVEMVNELTKIEISKMAYVEPSETEDDEATDDTTTDDAATEAALADDSVDDTPEVETNEDGLVFGFLPGAELQLTDEEGNVVESWVSGTEPHRIEGLPVGGKFILSEVKPVDGYATAASIEIIVEDSLTVQSFEMVDELTQIAIEKKTEDGKLLAGARLQVWQKNGAMVDEWLSTEEAHIIKGLVVGETYILREESAPNGYQKAADVEFVVQDTAEVQKVEMKDVKIPNASPHTGDDGNPLGLLATEALLLMSTIGCGWCINRRRKKERGER